MSHSHGMPRLEGVAMSFNGGKDCTVLLHLLTLGFYRYCKQRGLPMPRIRTVYIAQQDPFPEVEAFVDECVER